MHHRQNYPLLHFKMDLPINLIFYCRNIQSSNWELTIIHRNRAKFSIRQDEKQTLKAISLLSAICDESGKSAGVCVNMDFLCIHQIEVYK